MAEPKGPLPGGGSRGSTTQKAVPGTTVLWEAAPYQCQSASRLRSHQMLCGSIGFGELKGWIASMAGGTPLFLAQPYKAHTLPPAFSLRILKINPTPSIFRPGLRSTAAPS